MTLNGPQFPDPLGVREAVRPGATVHKAGLSVEQQVQALTQGALSIPGPGVTDGSIPIADTASRGRTKWAMTDNFYRRLVFQAHGYKFGSTGSGTTYLLGSDSSTTVASPLATATTVYTVPVFRIASADYSVTGKTTKLTLDASVLTNATAPSVNVSVALLPISAVAGGANALSFTYGTAVGTTTFTTPSASQHNYGSTTLDLPTDGPYVAAFAFSGSQAANSMVAVTARVFVSWV